MCTGVQLLLIGVGWLALAVIEGGWMLVLLWVSASFFAVGFAYLRGLASVFGKRADGSLSRFRVVLWLPYLLLTWAVWNLGRRVRTERPYYELQPGVFIGRRLTPKEWPGGVATILDLTCEFPGSAPHGRDVAYNCLPVLDRSAPAPEELVSVLNRVRGMHKDIYIHCAEGHGRTGLAAAALILIEGTAGSSGDAIRIVQSVRPGVRLHERQFAALEGIEAIVSRSAETNNGLAASGS